MGLFALHCRFYLGLGTLSAALCAILLAHHQLPQEGTFISRGASAFVSPTARLVWSGLPN
ncbi:cation efflux system protein NrsA, fragment [Arthrospira platensis NIES-39]|nr:cation efflux system protein NrsA, fragment [Arthrospira platensis NIES-39]